MIDDPLVPAAPAGRFNGIVRNYTPEDVARLRGSLPISYTGKLPAYPLSDLKGVEFIEAVKRVQEAIDRTNAEICNAVDLGLTVELVRASRCHDQNGNWGDQMIPSIREKGQ